MANKPKNPKHIEANICGAKLRNEGRAKDWTCHRSPMPNGRCHIHGGKSTGPKNSLAYYRKTLMGDDVENAAVENPMDLEGELAFARSLLAKMDSDPLRVYCAACKMWVVAEVTCPNEKHDEKGRDHWVNVRDNDYTKVIHATKLLSDIAKSYKEIVKGKEITLRVEVLNVVIQRVVEAYEAADRITEKSERRSVFIDGLSQLLIEQPSESSLSSRLKETDYR